MSLEKFMEQKPCYEKDYKNSKWRIITNFNRTRCVNKELEEFFKDEVYMNMLYFNTTDFNIFKKYQNWKSVYAECIKSTKELIADIIQPQCIICFGIPNCFNRFKGDSQVKEIAPKLLHESSFNNIPVYGIPHPSARIANKERERLGGLLYEQLCNKKLL